MFTDKESFKTAFVEKIEHLHGKNLEEATSSEKYLTLGTMVREYLSKDWIATINRYNDPRVKQAYYFSMEFLLGRQAGNNLMNLGIFQICREGLQDMGVDLEELETKEPDAGLGNGGLGRLAACFLDSLATLSLPGHGCGIRYKYGIFVQKIVEGYQVELPEHWLKEGNVWEIRRSDKAVEVKFWGNVRQEEVDGQMVFHHENYEPVKAVPYDTPVVGYHNNTVNNLRLWSAESAFENLDLDLSCQGLNTQQKILDYKYTTESISQFLYPDDTHREGRILRLKQEYFLASAGVQSIVRFYKRHNQDLKDIHNRAAIHINDTHPVLAIPELMRILMDEEGLSWDEACHITTHTISYTNHTTLAEALETWPVEMFKALLRRIYMIVEEMNKRFCQKLWDMYPGDWDRIKEMAIISDGLVKMSHMAIVGSYSVNGVAKIHTEIIKKKEMKLFYESFPHKFNNKTNGITHRRWLLKANPLLSNLISEAIGTSWIKHPEDLIGLLKYARDSSFQEKIHQAKQQNKEKLAEFIRQKNGITVDVNSIFDVQIKRLHAYKRQIMNVLHIIDLYSRLRQKPEMKIAPRTFIFGAKAAPGYHLAKRTIKLINSVASVVNADARISDQIKIVFLENYRVSLAEMIIPATDVSQQISTASKEASGTGNMKLMMNGAVTLGTMDGANIEIYEEVGEDNIFVFGLSPDEVLNFYRFGGYNAREIYELDPRIRNALDKKFFPAGWDEFNTIYNSLLNNNDEFFVLKDFASYVDAQEKINQEYQNRQNWTEKCIINIARSGKFSSDRTISQYAAGIWDINRVVVG